MTIRFSHTAVAVALAVAFQPSFANNDDEAVIVVTASRFDAADRTVPAHVTTLTRKDIATTPANNLPDLLATRAGVDVRSLYGNQAANASVSLRGFGENGNLRTLILVDGRRLDSLEFDTPNWNSIPLESIDRIEIIRSSGSVLYGDQAVAGVINIITQRGRENTSTVTLGAGSFGSRSLSTSISRHDTPLRFAFSASHSESDEYRRNNAHHNTNGSLRISRDMSAGEIHVEAGASELRYGLPGAVTAAQWSNDPRSAETTDSWFQRENHYLRPGIRWQISPNIEAAAELSLDQSRNRSWISNWPSYRDVQVTGMGFSPRLRWSHGLGKLPSVTVSGIDWMDARLDQDQSSLPGGNILKRVALERTGIGFYVQNSTQATETFSFTAGVRQQRFHILASDSSVASPSDSTTSKTATDLGMVWQAAPAWKLFAKTSSTFRYPVLDELTTFSGLATPPAKPESGQGRDIGIEWRGKGNSVQITHYDLKMNDEIAWNNITFQNENLQQTRHRGVEIDSRWKLTSQWRLNVSWTGKTAIFSEGANIGKTIPLVPETRVTAMLSWDGGEYGNHAILANHVGSRYFGGDDGNVRRQLPAYTTLDWQSRWLIAHWELAARITNLGNRKYAPFGFDYGFGASYYPANPRAAYLTARYSF